MKNKVTVIVPIYNVEKYVAKCLDSLINQTLKEIEVFAVIDGSPDNSIEIVKKYAKKDSRIKCIDKENGGYGSVLEYSLERIKTDYFLICDPDDWLREDAVETLYNAAIKNNADIVVGDKYLVYSDNEQTDYCSSILHPGTIEPNKLYKGKEVGRLVNLSVSPHSKLFKTSLANKIKFPRKVNYTDFLLFMVSLSNAKSALYIDEALSYYLIDRVGNSVTDVSIKAVNGLLTVFKETLSILENKKCDNSYIYYGMYHQLRYTILNVAAKLSKENYKIAKKDIRECLFLLKPYKKDIKKYVKYNNKLKTIYNRLILSLLFNKVFSLTTMKFLIKLAKKRKIA